jgi:hypothetical protein
MLCSFIQVLKQFNAKQPIILLQVSQVGFPPYFFWIGQKTLFKELVALWFHTKYVYDDIELQNLTPEEGRAKGSGLL